MTPQEFLSTFVLLWAVIDPIGTVPVFLHATAENSSEERRRIAFLASVTAAGLLLFFIVVGEVLLRAMGVPLLAFQIAGGIILFLFALTMIFGESKPESEEKLTTAEESHTVAETAVFPIATPSLASPGAMMAVVLLTENARVSLLKQAEVALAMVAVVACAFLLMRNSDAIARVIGRAGAGIVSRVMGMILASIAAANVLEGIKRYFSE